MKMLDKQSLKDFLSAIGGWGSLESALTCITMCRGFFLPLAWQTTNSSIEMKPNDLEEKRGQNHECLIFAPCWCKKSNYDKQKGNNYEKTIRAAN